MQAKKSQQSKNFIKKIGILNFICICLFVGVLAGAATFTAYMYRDLPTSDWGERKTELPWYGHDLVIDNIITGWEDVSSQQWLAMSGISHDLSGAAQIDGASVFQEFWHVTLPGVFPTLMPFLIAGVATIFTNQFNLFSFYGATAPDEVQTYGYYLYVKALGAKSVSEYPLLSAMGLMMTVVVVPVTLLVKHLLETHGPRED